jgi:hypothetical protein
MRESAHPRPTQLPVVQPTPAMHQASPLAVGATALAMAFIVVVVLYGMTRGPQDEQQAASAPVSTPQTPTAAPETTGTAPADERQAGAPAQQGRGSNERATTGQTAGQDGSQAEADKPAATTPEQNRGQQSQTQDNPPTSGEAATGTTGGPSARPARTPPAPQQR